MLFRLFQTQPLYLNWSRSSSSFKYIYCINSNPEEDNCRLCLCRLNVYLLYIHFSYCTQKTNKRIRQHEVSQIFDVSLSLQLLHRFALLLESGSHRLHDSGLKKLRPSETHKHTSVNNQMLCQCVKL